MGTALATTLHDPEAVLAGPFEDAAPGLAKMFDGLAVSLTAATHPRMERVLADALGARVTRHPTGEEFIGRGRREAVALALELGTDRVLYADPDHALHWLNRAPDELRAVLAVQPETGFLIVGRSERAFAAVPQRLQQTEGPINRAYELLTGRRADLLAAVRRMDRAAGSRRRRSLPDRQLCQRRRVAVAGGAAWPHGRLCRGGRPAVPHDRAVLGGCGRLRRSALAVDPAHRDGGRAGEGAAALPPVVRLTHWSVAHRTR